MMFKCFISGTTFTKQVYPFNIQDIARKCKKKEGDIYFRFELTEDLTFTNYPSENIDDATFFYSWLTGKSDFGYDEKITLQIYQVDGTIDKLWYTGSFRFYNLKVTTDNYKYLDVTLKPSLEDNYTVFDNNKSKDFNIIDGLTKYDVGYYYYSDIEFAFIYANLFQAIPELGDGWGFMFNWANNSYGGDPGTLWGYRVYGREIITLPKDLVITGLTDVWTNVEETDNYIKYAIDINTNCSDIYPFFFVKTGVGWLFPKTGIALTTVEKNNFINIGYTEVNAENPDDLMYLRNDYLYNVRNAYKYSALNIAYKLKDCLNNLIQKIDSTRTVKSSFLFNDNNENEETITGNYVTEDLPNIFNNAYLIDKRDFKRPNASQLTTIANTKLEDINSDLFTLFQIYPFIDKNKTYRYEHIKYWSKELGIDLRIDFDEYINDKYSFEFDNVKIPNREKFTPIEASSTDFLENNIEYDNVAPLEYGENIIERSTKIFYTDVDNILRNLEGTSDEGFVLVVLDDDGNIKISTGILSNWLIQNVDLSFANLIPKYWIYDRPYMKGYINSVLTDFTMKKIKSGDEIEIVSKEDIDPDKLIRTYLGDGEVDELIEYLDGRKKIKLLYNL